MVSRLWTGILAQATCQLDPQGTRIQEYRTENPNQQAQLTDVDIAKLLFNARNRGKKLDAVIYQIIQSQVGNIRQILIDNEDFHKAPDLNLDQMFKINEEEIDEIHQKYIIKLFHQTQESNVIILCDAADEIKFNGIKNKALQRHDESTSTLTFSVNNNIDPRDKPTKPYYRNLANLDQIDTLLDQIYRHEQHSAFKIRADFGTIIETSEYDRNEQKISNKYILPIDTNTERRVPLILKSQENIESYKHYIRDVIASMQERTQQDTHQKIVAIFSIMKWIYKFSLAGAAIPSFITIPNSKEKRWKDCSRIAERKRIFKRIYGKEFDDLYQGFNFATDIDEFIEKEQINVHLFTYGDKDQSPTYYTIHQYKCDTSERDFNVLLINNGVNAHMLYISDVQALTGYRYCDICKLQAFKTSNPNITRDMKRYMEKCKKNNGQIVKEVILEKFARPFVPHKFNNITYRYLFVNDRQIEFKPTEYYITYDIETFEKFIQQNYGEESTVISYLFLVVLHQLQRTNQIYIHSAMIFDKLIFLNQWLDQVFEEAKQIKRDNKYEDESIAQHFEVLVIGFNSTKFDVSLVFKNLKSKNWRIIKHISSGTVAKQIIIRHKDTHIQLRFIDALIYCTKMTLKKFDLDIVGGTMTKGRLPYEYININNQVTDLDKSESFPRETFNKKLKNKSISESKYQEYLVEAAKFTTK
ncbi:MAG: hypothetical protein EZS28_032906 [Streblomastix strix]|uniref:Uncharacterized protein n=1 Tax=Streblomastix strix TaxID=222440 RepID=A0A5J4UMF4_9EUKA|nr:MAG: hypothetical protein EZS28_032906 [Streblomastix strix]